MGGSVTASRKSVHIWLGVIGANVSYGALSYI